MLKAIKIRIYPNDEQINYIKNLLGTSRFVYNNCLAYKIDKYNNEKYSVNFAETSRYLTSLKSKEGLSWIRNSHSKVLGQSLINLEYAYKNFFKNGSGFPKFKSKHDNRQSCRFPSDAFIGIKGNKISLIKQLKEIHFKCSKRDEKILNKYQDSVRSVTLTKTKSGKYYLSVLMNLEISKKLDKPINSIIGIDLGIKSFIVDSKGNEFKTIKVNRKKLEKLHRQLSRKQKNSKNREKSRIKLAKLYEKINNIKEYYLHQIVNQLLNENQIIVIEDLNIKGMLKNHKLARSIQELSINRFETILKYKSEWYGRDIIKIDRFFPSSKLCSDCGFRYQELSLLEREWICPKCGTKHNRDFNAANNIEKEGQRILDIKEKQIGLSSPEFTLAEIGSVDDIVRNNALKSTQSLKQEKNVFNRFG